MQLQLFGYLKMLNCPIYEDKTACGCIDSLLFVKCYHHPYPRPPIPAWTITIWLQVIDDDEQRDRTFRTILSQLCVMEACRRFQIACSVIDLLLPAFSQSTVPTSTHTQCVDVGLMLVLCTSSDINMFWLKILKYKRTIWKSVGAEPLLTTSLWKEPD